MLNPMAAGTGLGALSIFGSRSGAVRWVFYLQEDLMASPALWRQWAGKEWVSALNVEVLGKGGVVKYFVSWEPGEKAGSSMSREDQGRI
jgi:hypothetical protein